MCRVLNVQCVALNVRCLLGLLALLGLCSSDSAPIAETLYQRVEFTVLSLSKCPTLSLLSYCVKIDIIDTIDAIDIIDAFKVKCLMGRCLLALCFGFGDTFRSIRPLNPLIVATLPCFCSLSTLTMPFKAHSSRWSVEPFGLVGPVRPLPYIP